MATSICQAWVLTKELKYAIVLLMEMGLFCGKRFSSSQGEEMAEKKETAKKPEPKKQEKISDPYGDYMYNRYMCISLEPLPRQKLKEEKKK